MILKRRRGGAGGEAARMKIPVLPLKIPLHFQIVFLAALWVPGGNDKWQ